MKLKNQIKIFATISVFFSANAIADGICPSTISWDDAQKLKKGEMMEHNEYYFRGDYVKDLPSSWRVLSGFVFKATKVDEKVTASNTECTYGFKTAVSGALGNEKMFTILGPKPATSVTSSEHGFIRKPQKPDITIHELPVDVDDDPKLKAAQKELEEMKKLQKETEKMLKR